MNAFRITLMAIALAVLAAACSAGAATGSDTEVGSVATPVSSEVAAPTQEAEAAAAAPASDEIAPPLEAKASVEATASVEEGQPAAAVAAACPSGSFLIEAVNAYEQAGYADPELAVTCDAESFTVTSNGIPNFEFVQITPNALEAQNLTFTLPLEPAEAETPGALPLGPIGISANGLAIFGAFEAPQDGYKDPLLDGLLDYCNGHTAPRGLYHVHARFDCVFDDPEAPGLVYGYAADGYPILSPNVCLDEACTEVERLTSSYVRIDPEGLGAFDAWAYVEGAGDLDECNGSYDAAGNYAYYATDDFPYLTFCFHGETELAAGDFVGDPPAGP
jgi:hypothetical protein